MVGRQPLASGATDGKLWRCQIKKRACLSRTRRPKDRCHPRLITRCGCNCPTMNSLSRADRLGRVPCVQFKVIQQILIGYRCRVDKAADSTCALLNDATPARPTNWHLSRCGWTSPPLTDWKLITIQWTYSGYRLPTRMHAQVASRWIRVSIVVKRSLIIGPAVYCTVLNPR